VRLLATALALVALIALGLVLGGLIANRVPLLAPPGPLARLWTYLGTNVAETSDRPRLPELAVPEYPVPAARLEQALEAALASLGWAWRRDPASGAYHAVVVTPLWRFADDVTVRVTGAAPGQSRLQVRSASRVGRGDLGANLRHLLELRAAVERRLEDG
jgi:hypothetical protein